MSKGKKADKSESRGSFKEELIELLGEEDAMRFIENRNILETLFSSSDRNDTLVAAAVADTEDVELYAKLIKLMLGDEFNNSADPDEGKRYTKNSIMRTALMMIVRKKMNKL